jgi:hypothetical protein
MIPCNVQAPMRRVGRTDWIDVVLILNSLDVRLKVRGS